MNVYATSIVIVMAACIVLSGCQPDSDAAGESKGSVYANDNKDNDHGHSHDQNDALHWAKKDVEQDGFAISLGHHGKHFHIGDAIEPAVMIVRDGKVVADAEVYNSLVSADGQTILVEEVKTVFEPETGTEPAHYAQASLKIPEGAEKFRIRYRIKLPGIAEDASMDIEASAHGH